MQRDWVRMVDTLGPGEDAVLSLSNFYAREDRPHPRDCSAHDEAVRAAEIVDRGRLSLSHSGVEDADASGVKAGTTTLRKVLGHWDAG